MPNSTVVPALADVTNVDRLYRPLPISPPALHVAGDFTTYDVVIVDDEGVSIFEELAIPVVDTDPVFNTLQPWDRDSIGYNFRHVLRMSELGADKFRGGRSYRAIYTLHGGATYGDVPVDFTIHVRSLGPL